MSVQTLIPLFQIAAQVALQGYFSYMEAAGKTGKESTDFFLEEKRKFEERRAKNLPRI